MERKLGGGSAATIEGSGQCDKRAATKIELRDRRRRIRAGAYLFPKMSGPGQWSSSENSQSPFREG